MDHGVLKHWHLFLLAAATLSFGVYKLAMKPSAMWLHPEDQSYEMLRPKASAPGYDLSGRQVVRDIHSIPTQTVASAPAPAAKASTPPAKAKAAADAKAKAAKAEAAKKAEIAKRRAMAQAAKRRAQMAVRTVDKSHSTMTGFGTLITTNANGYSGGGYPPPVAPTGPDSHSDPANEDDKIKLSPAQWRSLLHGQPNEKNAADFAAAFHKGEVDAATFYQVAQELLTDSGADRQKIGLLILKQDTSPKSFSVLVANYKDQTPEPMKTEIYNTLKGYSDVSNFSVMNKVLLSEDARAVSMATSLLKKVVDAQGAVKQDTSGREGRSPGSSPIATSQFQTFIPTLRRLASSDNATVAQQAQTLLESIQAMKAA